MESNEAVKIFHEELLTRQEVAALLHLSLPTLDSYIRKQLIVAYRIGNRILFKRDDIYSALKSIPATEAATL